MGGRERCDAASRSKLRATGSVAPLERSNDVGPDAEGPRGVHLVGRVEAVGAEVLGVVSERGAGRVEEAEEHEIVTADRVDEGVVEELDCRGGLKPAELLCEVSFVLGLHDRPPQPRLFLAHR